MLFWGRQGPARRTPGLKLTWIVALLLVLAVVGYLWQGYLSKGKAVTQPGSPFDMVELRDYIPGIQIELAYASDNNVYKKPMYDSDQALLRRGTAAKLKKAQQALQSRGYALKIWDAYRPPQAQYKLWEVMPDRRYVIDPNQGFSNHSRGAAVDVTVVDQTGQELSMPTGFDNFSARADRDYSDISPLQAENAILLEKAMIEAGFNSIYYEWWHFNDADLDRFEVYWPPQPELQDVAG